MAEDAAKSISRKPIPQDVAETKGLSAAGETKLVEIHYKLPQRHYRPMAVSNGSAN